MDLDVLATVGVGLVLGARHAFEPDHVAAVTMLATRQRQLGHVAGLGAAWGAGHSASVALVAAVVIAVGLRVPPVLESAAELGVGILLIAIGVPVVWRYMRGRWHMHVHSHDGTRHLHLHSHARDAAHVHAHPRWDAVRSGGFGVIHGLAGSGALVVLLLASAPDTGTRVLWFVAFATGSVLGMVAVSLAVAILVNASAAGARGGTLLHVGSALAAVAIGIIWAGRTLLVV